MPKSKGGLGLRKADAINKAFQCKLAWKVLTDESSLWVQSMKAKYLKNSCLLEYKRKSTDSPVWKSLLNCRDLLRRGIVWKIGNGDKVSFWFDNWLGNHNLVEMLNMSAANVPSLEAKVSDFILQNRNWNIGKLTQILNDQAIIKKVQGITIPNHDIEDTFCWGLNGSGNFSTKSATWMAQEPQLVHNTVWKHKWIWQIDTMPKIKNFLWQVCYNAIPIRGLLLARGLHLDPACPLCLDDIESLDHMFKECCMIKKV